jgi:hypothetical protein
MQQQRQHQEQQQSKQHISGQVSQFQMQSEQRHSEDRRLTVLNLLRALQADLNATLTSLETSQSLPVTDDESANSLPSDRPRIQFYEGERLVVVYPSAKLEINQPAKELFIIAGPAGRSCNRCGGSGREPK